MKSVWGALHRVRLGPRAFKPGGNTEAVRWCNENCIDNFFASIGFEVFYFKNPADAVVFKLKWFGHTNIR